MSAITFHYDTFQLSIFLIISVLIISFVLVVSVVLIVSVILIVLVLVLVVLVVLVVFVVLFVIHNFTSRLRFENSFCSLSKTIPITLNESLEKFCNSKESFYAVNKKRVVAHNGAGKTY